MAHYYFSVLAYVSAIIELKKTARKMNKANNFLHVLVLKKNVFFSKKTKNKKATVFLLFTLFRKSFLFEIFFFFKLKKFKKKKTKHFLVH